MRDTSHVDTAQQIVTAEDVDARPRQTLQPGVAYTVLWRAGHSVAGVMWVEPGACVEEHTHRHAAHHVWLVSGEAAVAGRIVAPGSYWHVPAGTLHAVHGFGAQGCVPHYLYLPE